jgi:hypothetical protein
MSDKQVYELSIDDLAHSGVWFFPMDDSVEDELTVRPLQEVESCADAQLIVRAHFEGRNGARYLGYLYWDGNGGVEYLKPVVLLDDGSAISFWSGIAKPSWAEYSEKAQALRKALPITYISEPLLGLPELSGVLEGLGYLDGDAVSWV